MTIENFANWCAFFREQIVKQNEDSVWLDSWFDDLKNAGIEDAMEAVRHLRKTMTRWDVAKKTLGRILSHIDALEQMRSKRRSANIAVYEREAKEKAELPEAFSYVAMRAFSEERRRLGDTRPMKELMDEYIQSLGKKKRRKGVMP